MVVRLSSLLLIAAASVVEAQSLPRQLESLAPGQWLSYEVPLQPGLRAPCCFGWKRDEPHDASCRLEQDNWTFGHRDSDPSAPSGSALRVLLRRGADGFDRVRAVGTQCSVDAGTATVLEAGTVDADASVALLSPALSERSARDRHHLLAAIAYHASTQADNVLQQASAIGREDDLRRDAVFWLAEARGESGYRHVRALLERETDDDLRRHEVFALSISKAPGAAPELRALATRHAVDEVRAEAIFWLAQAGDPQTEVIAAEMLAREGSREVREKAVFALSQLPSVRAIPALRALVERGGPREVRKQAIFWLAQIDDEAVLPVFDQLLGERSN